VRLIYSLGATFGGPGIGTTAHHAVRGLHRHGLLLRLLCGSRRATEIPADRIRALGLASRLLRRAALEDPSGWLGRWHDRLYGRWSAAQLEPCDVFQGWNGHCLEALAPARRLGALTLVECASWHPEARFRRLREAHRRLGLRYPDRPSVRERALAELEGADRVLVPSEPALRSFLAEGWPAERLLQIPFGVDAARFRPRGQPRPGPFRVLFVGDCSVRKGIAELLQAWRQLAWRDAELWLVGRIPRQLAPLLRPARSLPGLRPVGFVRDPAPWYAQADVFAFPTLEEGSALVTYEALASGLPVITTPEAGSVVRDGREGYLVPSGDPEALCARLETLRSDPALRARLGRAARARAEQFSWERYGDALARSVEALAGAPETGSCASR
jgi:glycosyltransferase involved in cell wall biosynthesis